MTMLETITIVCDADGCLAMHEGTREAYRGHAMSSTFQGAQDEGWRVRLVDRRQHWTCPTHAPTDGSRSGASGRGSGDFRHSAPTAPIFDEAAA